MNKAFQLVVQVGPRRKGEILVLAKGILVLASPESFARKVHEELGVDCMAIGYAGRMSFDLFFAIDASGPIDIVKTAARDAINHVIDTVDIAAELV